MNSPKIMEDLQKFIDQISRHIKEEEKFKMLKLKLKKQKSFLKSYAHKFDLVKRN